MIRQIIRDNPGRYYKPLKYLIPLDIVTQAQFEAYFEQGCKAMYPENSYLDNAERKAQWVSEMLFEWEMRLPWLQNQELD